MDRAVPRVFFNVLNFNEGLAQSIFHEGLKPGQNRGDKSTHHISTYFNSTNFWLRFPCFNFSMEMTNMSFELRWSRMWITRFWWTKSLLRIQVDSTVMVNWLQQHLYSEESWSWLLQQRNLPNSEVNQGIVQNYANSYVKSTQCMLFTLPRCDVRQSKLDMLCTPPRCSVATCLMIPAWGWSAIRTEPVDGCTTCPAATCLLSPIFIQVWPHGYSVGYSHDYSCDRINLLDSDAAYWYSNRGTRWGYMLSTVAGNVHRDFSVFVHVPRFWAPNP